MRLLLRQHQARSDKTHYHAQNGHRTNDLKWTYTTLFFHTIIPYNSAYNCGLLRVFVELHLHVLGEEGHESRGSQDIEYTRQDVEDQQLVAQESHEGPWKVLQLGQVRIGSRSRSNSVQSGVGGEAATQG